jgi:hypothetical protein
MRSKSLLVIPAVLGMLLLAGCGSSNDSTASYDVSTGGGVSTPEIGAAPMPQAVDGGIATDGKAVAPNQPGAPNQPVVTDRQVIRSGSLSMTVDNVPKTASSVRALVTKNKGFIASEDSQAGTGQNEFYSNITAQIPAAGLDAFVAEVSKLGEVTATNIQAQDVTSTVTDLDARMKALKTSIDRLNVLMSESGNVSDLLAVESAISQRQAELDSLTAQRKMLGEQVALSTITVSLSPVTAPEVVESPGFTSGLESGWAAFISLAGILATTAGFMIPFLVIMLLILIPVAWFTFRAVRRRKRAKPEVTA